MKSGGTPEKIEAYYEGRKESEPRSYIGASVIGDPCDAALQYSLRGFDQKKPSPRLQRVFDLGHLIEKIVVRDLRNAGEQIFEFDALTGKQFHYSEFGGHVACNLDLQFFRDEEVLVGEVKSMNDDQWNKFKRDGIHSSHPKYWDQMQMCMGMSGIRKAIMIAYNKNTSEYWDEIVEFSEIAWDAMTMRINLLLGGARQRVAKEETDWRCRGCWRNDICWQKREPTQREKSRCQSCVHSKPVETGGWHCELHNRSCNEACGNWALLLPEERK